MNSIRRTFCSVISFVLIVSLLIPVGSGSISYAEHLGSMELTGTLSKQLTQGVTLTEVDMVSERGNEKAFVMDVDVTKNPRLDFAMTLANGNVVGGVEGPDPIPGETVTDLAKRVSVSGKTVIGGVNSDFFPKIAKGMYLDGLVANGIWLQSPGTHAYAFAVNFDGTAQIGIPRLDVSLAVNRADGQTKLSGLKVDGINTLRDTQRPLVIYTRDYFTLTDTNDAGTEVVISDVQGQMTSHGTLTGTVTRVNTNLGNSSIPEGGLVLSGLGSAKADLETLQIGDTIEIQLQADPEWENVKELATGWLYGDSDSAILLQDGMIMATDDTVHPRTALGIRADGSVMIIAADGRQGGYSTGMTQIELAEMMRDLGAVDAINFDGGGSTAMVAQGPEDSRPVVINSPSDQSEHESGQRLVGGGVFVTEGDRDVRQLTRTMKGDPKTTQSFSWQTGVHVTGTVLEYLPLDQYSGFPDRNAIRVTGTEVVHETNLGYAKMHQVEAVGLEPGTEYAYRVGDGKDGGWSEAGTFRTESANKEPFTFLFTSDTQAPGDASDPNWSYRDWGNVLTRSLEHYPDARFMVISGDIVDYGSDQTHWEAWYESVEGVLPGINVMPTIGNHETYHDREIGYTNFRTYFPLPYNGPDGEEGLAYSFHYGDVHLAVLNSEGDLEKQGEWLKQDMQDSDASWRIVSFHRPPYHTHPTRENPDIREAWPPVFDELEIDLVLNGHDHAYMRTHPLYDEQIVEEGEGTTYIIGGTAGPKFYEIGNQPWMKVGFNDNVNLFSAITVDGKTLTFKAMAMDGQIPDEFTFVKSSDITSIELEGSEYASPGEEISFHVTAKTAENTSLDVTNSSILQSSNEEVAVIGDNGKVIAVATGTTVITAEFGGFSTSLTLVVQPPTVNSLNIKGINPTSVGTLQQVFVNAFYSDGTVKDVTQEADLRSSDQSVAQINDSGEIITLAEGTSVISAVYESTEASYLLMVRNVMPEPVSIAFQGSSEINLTAGKTIPSILIAHYRDGSSLEIGSGVNYFSNNEEVVRIDNQGNLTAGKPGQAQITAVYGDLKAELSVRVDSMPMGIQLRNSQIDLKVGETEQMITELMYADEKLQPVSDGVIYQVADSRIASVDEHGLLTGLKAGETKVTVSYSVYETTGTVRIESKSSSHGGSSGYYPIFPVETVQPSQPEEQTEGQIKWDDVVELAAGEDELELPWNIAELINEDGVLTIRQGDFTFSLPQSSLKQMLQEVPEEMRSKGVLQFKLEEVGEGFNSWISETQEIHGASLRAGGMWRVGFIVVDEAGQTHSLKPHAKAIANIQMASGLSEELTVMYQVDHDGSLEYIQEQTFMHPNTITIPIDDWEAVYAVLEYNKTFDDVVEGHWAEQAIKYLSARQIVQGMMIDEFAPSQTVTRAEFAAMLTRALGIETPEVSHASFADVDENAWYAGAVAAATSAGIVSGVSETAFLPNDAITREQMAVMLVRAYEYLFGEQDLSTSEKFTDDEEISNWAKIYVDKAYVLGFMQGRSTLHFVPKEQSMRSESAQVLYNILKSDS